MAGQQVRRPSTVRTDREIYRRWRAGEAPKAIAADLDLSRDQVYHSLDRTRDKKRK